MASILVDTHIFRRLKGSLRDLLYCISSIGDTIIYSKEIENEYKIRTSPTELMYYGYLQNVKKYINMEFKKSSRINARFKRNIRSIELSKHMPDNKWIRHAVSEGAKYIISYNSDLAVRPFRTNEHLCRVISPEFYIQENSNNK